ncbi:MAG: alpha/beta fold hydrolase [Thermoleophilia bacterium]|nr:alpha/beta fold hydrolase [Thermoleophilia bacterium]
MAYRDLPGARVAYDVAGEGPPVVLIHGWACRRSDFAPIMADLARDHRVLALDLPWHGDSTSDLEYWPIDDLAAIVQAIAADEGMRDCALVGHSAGAAVAVEAVLAGAGRRVVALDGLTFMHMYPRIPPDAAERVLAPFREDFPGAVRALCERAAGPGTDPAITRQVADEMAQMDPVVGVRMLAGLLTWDMDAALGRAGALGLSVTACASRCLLAPEVVDAYGHRFEIVPVDLGGHFFLREDPSGTAALIREAVRPDHARG